jgi:Tol biopolymer transport system component
MRSDGTDLVKCAAAKSDDSQVGVPTWSPDGKRIAYIRSIWAYNARTSSVEVNEWQPANAGTLFSDSRLSPALHWLADGRLIYAFGSPQNQQDSSLWVVSLQNSGRRKIDQEGSDNLDGHVAKLLSHAQHAIAPSQNAVTILIQNGEWNG